MMYHKALLFDDNDIAEKIMKETANPAKCKKLGRQVKNFDDVIWKSNARRIVEDGVYLKFTQNGPLKRELLSTKDLTLVEAAPRDRTWGIGYSANKALTVPTTDWGSNWLGEVLMNIRSRIRDEEQLAEKEAQGISYSQQKHVCIVSRER